MALGAYQHQSDTILAQHAGPFEPQQRSCAVR